MIDFHTHILPGIDDGAKDVSVSAAMLEMEKEQIRSRSRSETTINVPT